MKHSLLVSSLSVLPSLSVTLQAALSFAAVSFSYETQSNSPYKNDETMYQQLAMHLHASLI